MLVNHSCAYRFVRVQFCLIDDDTAIISVEGFDTTPLLELISPFIEQKNIWSSNL